MIRKMTKKKIDKIAKHMYNVMRGLIKRGVSQELAKVLVVHKDDIPTRYNFLCPYCFMDIPLDEWSVDHMVPLSRGGANVEENLVVCCSRCNKLKGDLTQLEFSMLRNTLSCNQFSTEGRKSVERRMLYGSNMYRRFKK